MMNYQFAEDYRSLTLDTAEPDRPFENMLFNDAYLTRINQNGFGNGMTMNEDGHIAHIVENERIVYIRDDETGEVFSAGFAPVYTPYSSYQSTSGIGYQLIENVTSDLKVTWRIFVPVGDNPIEIWDLRIENGGDKKRNLSVFTYAEVSLSGVDLYNGALYRFAEYKKELNAIFILQDAEQHKTINFPNHNAFFTADRQAESWDALKDAFVGERNHLSLPSAVKNGRCTGSYASVFNPATCLQFKLSLDVGGVEDTRMMIGGCGNEAMIAELKETYLTGNLDADAHFDALLADREKMMENITISAPEESMNYMLNTWVKHQLQYGAKWVRWGYKGYRDIVQNSQGIVYQDLDQAKESLLKACRHQYQDGFALRGWHPTDPMRYADSAQWMIGAFSEYAKESGDIGIFDTEVPYFDEGSDTVYDHLMKAMVRLREDRGAHGLNLIFFGDWNDSLTGVGRKGKGESVWLSMAFARCALLMAELAEELGKADDVALMKTWHAEMSVSINEHCWDGEWYICALDDDGAPIGSKENEEGKIFLNTQSWAVLGDVDQGGRFDQAMESVEKYLDSGWGLTLNHPTYTKPVDNVGRLSYLRPGICENGSVYTHGNAFLLVALLERRKADRALKLWQDVAPGNPARPIKNPPNVFVNGYHGPDCDLRPGMAEHTWVTGSAGWMNFAVIEYLYGLRRTFKGLTLNPCMPSSWESASIVRTFRGVTYEVTIQNPSKKDGAALSSLTVNGEDFPVGRVLPSSEKQYTITAVVD